MIRSDRLLGLGRMLVDACGPRIFVEGVPSVVVTALSAAGAEPYGFTGRQSSGDAALLVISSAAEADSFLRQATLAPHAVVWVMAAAGRSRHLRLGGEPAGLRQVADYAATPDSASPTHLIRHNVSGARRWFSSSVRPAWGLRGRVARQLGRLAHVAPFGFQARAILLAGPTARLTWPLSPDGNREPPAIVTLGGGLTAGRRLLTFTDRQGTLERHVKIDPAERHRTAAHERTVLKLLGSAGTFGRTVPTVLGTETTTSWEATALSHLPGRTLERRWEYVRGQRRQADIDDVVRWIARLSEATATLDSTSVEKIRHSFNHIPERGLSADLKTAIESGARIAAGTERLIHGDLWAANIVRGSAGIGVLDWESARIGHPMADLLSLLISATQIELQPGSSLESAAVAALCNGDALVDRTSDRCRLVLRSVGMADPTLGDVRALILHQLAEMAWRPTHAGDQGPDGARWRDCLLAVWRCWSTGAFG
jgi:hypothetical protein